MESTQLDFYSSRLSPRASLDMEMERFGKRAPLPSTPLAAYSKESVNDHVTEVTSSVVLGCVSFVCLYSLKIPPLPYRAQQVRNKMERS